MFPIGMILLVVLALVIYLGLAHRVLDRMGLTDKVALGFIAAILVGSFLNIPLTAAPARTSINVGGGLIPIALAGYVLYRAGTTKEVVRAIVAAIATAAIIFFMNTRLTGTDPWQTGTDFLDPLYIYPLVAGLLAYLLGRSRRGAFVAATIGVLLLDIYDLIYLRVTGTPGNVSIGGAGALDVILLSGVIAVLLAEFIGETRERLQGGPASEGRPPALLRNLSKLQGHHPLGQPARKEMPDRTAISKTDEERGDDIE